MATAIAEQELVQTLDIRKEIAVAAPVDITFEAVLEQLGPESQMSDGRPFPMKLEPWPGGRWYRDLGNNSGHLWGHVQVIKPPTLLEIWGPLMMSYPAINQVQYRLKPEGTGTHITFLHRALGLILPEHRDGMPKGWEDFLERFKEIAERKAAARTNAKRGMS
jgi:uncharacterized protein YndB with AHSA1/START domain